MQEIEKRTREATSPQGCTCGGTWRTTIQTFKLSQAPAVHLGQGNTGSQAVGSGCSDWVAYGRETVPEALMGESDGGVLSWMFSLDNKMMDGKGAKVRAEGSLDTAGMARIRESSHFSQVFISSA